MDKTSHLNVRHYNLPYDAIYLLLTKLSCVRKNYVSVRQDIVIFVTLFLLLDFTAYVYFVSIRVMSNMRR